MTHITLGKMILNINKNKIPWIENTNKTPVQGHHLPLIDSNKIEEEKLN